MHVFVDVCMCVCLYVHVSGQTYGEGAKGAGGLFLFSCQLLDQGFIQGSGEVMGEIGSSSELGR